MVNISSFLVVSFFLFLLGLLGILLNRSNIIVVLISIEIILLSVTLNIVAFSVYFDDFIGQLFCLFILTVAAGESAVGLAILVACFRVRGSIEIKHFNIIHG